MDHLVDSSIESLGNNLDWVSREIGDMDRRELRDVITKIRGHRGKVDMLLGELEERYDEHLFAAFEDAARTVDTFEKLNERLDSMRETLNHLSERN